MNAMNSLGKKYKNSLSVGTVQYDEKQVEKIMGNLNIFHLKSPELDSM